MINKKNIWIIATALLIPLVGAYPLGLPMLNLWDALIEYTFGSFWISIFALCIIFFIILAIGGVSAWTNLTYEGIFVLSMAIGYGQAIVTIPLWIGLMSWAVFQILQYLNTSSR